MSKRKDMQRLIRHYKDKTGETEVDMKKVAVFALNMGWEMPVPKSAVEILAKQFTNAAREETRNDRSTGRPYRANHALPIKQGAETLHLWIDIDEAPRWKMHKSLSLRREQMVGDGTQLIYDADHWNAIYPDEEKIHMEMDLTFDIELRKHADDVDDEAA